MSHPSSHCAGCRDYYGRINFLIGMIYDCADECKWVQMERAERRRAAESEAAEQQRLEDLKKQQEAEETLKRVDQLVASAEEPVWGASEFPRQYAAGWKLLVNGTLRAWVHKEHPYVACESGIPECPGFPIR